mgnify:CR=1 FL=1
MMKDNTIYIIKCIVTVILFALVLTLHYAMNIWTLKLEENNCNCSNLWQRKYINIISIIIAIMYFINIVMLFNLKNIQSVYIIIYKLIFTILQLFYISIIYTYITELKKIECKCSEDWKRDYGYISSIIFITLYALILLMFIIPFI